VAGTAGQVEESEAPGRRVQEPLERQILALDALSKLTRQFCERPDFEQLIDVLLMTLCGQFSTAESFALLKKPSAQSLNKSFFATGGFRKSILLASLPVEPGDWGCALGHRGAQRIGEAGTGGDTTAHVGLLTQAGVDVVCPLVHGRVFLGIVGLGAKVTGRPYADHDIELLNAVMNTVTPLVANSFLFCEIANLNAWYLEILNNVRQGVFVFDQAFQLRKVNSAGLDILRLFLNDSLDVGSIEGDPIEKVFPEPIFRGWARKFAETRAAGRSQAGCSIVASLGGDERIFSANITGSVEISEIGSALIITLDDVTEQKESEQRLFHLQKLADKGLMASSISHELNNFLGLILGGVELTEFALQGGDTKKAVSTLGKLKSNVAKMERFTMKLMESAATNTTKKRAGLSAIVQDVLSFVSVQRRFKGIEIESHLPGDLPEFLMDTDMITQLILNLLNNAGDAIREAGIEDGRIKIDAFPADKEVVLRISDNGAGMSGEITERLFKARFTTKQAGHGYGLVVCRDIVSDHGGTVEVSSEVGKGSTFTIRFPTRFEA
jgi:signal transduction histidine kinase